MNRLLLFLLTAIAISSVSAARPTPQQPDENDRQKWITEVRNFKHDFLIKELSLSKEQQKDFFEAYDEMEDRINRLNTETRELEQHAIDNDNASDVELDAAAHAVFNLKNEESKIEMEYFDRYKQILSSRQLIRLKSAERKFTQQLMLHHRRLKNGDGPRKK